MKCCGNCFYRKTEVYGPEYDTIKLSCKKGYKMNTLVQPDKKDCWRQWEKKAIFNLKPPKPEASPIRILYND